jgi:SPP1 family predicted phage head-tail adaptor
MRAGQLRHRVQIQEATETVNAYGERVKTWSTVMTRWASVAPASGKELMAAQQTVSQVSHVVRMRYTSGIVASMRLLHETSRTLRIDAVLNTDELDRELKLLCVETTNG